MRQDSENKDLQEAAVHPEVVTVSGDQSRRWCLAIWSTSPGEDKIIHGIRGLVEATLLAAVSQPPTGYEEDRGVVNSLDAVFYERPDQALEKALGDQGFQEVKSLGMNAEEYEQFEVFQRRARRGGRQVADRPSALWRVDVVNSTDEDHGLARIIAEAMEGQIWGQSPGWFSKVLCDALEKQRGQTAIGPDMEGLSTVESLLGVEASVREQAMVMIEPMIYQGLCDLVAVVIAQQSDLDVQWGSCPVDEESGLAPAPLIRARQTGENWHSLEVGRDVACAMALPWGTPRVEVGSRLAALASRYIEQCRH